MVTFNYETDFELDNKDVILDWIHLIIVNHDSEVGEINYIFCDDEYLHSLNVKYLNHDTLTDIISFDNTLGNLISGDIFISIERVKENAIEYKTSFTEELNRVMIHGILHYLGYKDKSSSDKEVMRKAENDALEILKY